MVGDATSDPLLRAAMFFTNIREEIEKNEWDSFSKLGGGPSDSGLSQALGVGGYPSSSKLDDFKPR